MVPQVIQMVRTMSQHTILFTHIQVYVRARSALSEMVRPSPVGPDFRGNRRLLVLLVKLAQLGALFVLVKFAV